MCRNVAIGCSALLGALLVCGIGLSLWVTALARRIAPPLPDAPVSVEGACPEDEVMAWVTGYEAREEAAASALGVADESFEQDEGTGSFLTAEHPADDADVAAYRAVLDRIAASQVPPCVAELRDAELQRHRLFLRSYAVIQGGVGPLRFVPTAGVVLGISRGYAPRNERIEQGYARLGERLSKDLSEHVPYPDPQE